MAFQFFQIISQKKELSPCVKYLLSLFQDSTRILSRLPYLMDRDSLFQKYKEEIRTIVEQSFVNQFILEIDQCLRYKNQDQYLPPRDPAAENPIHQGVVDVKNCLQVEPIYLFGERVPIKTLIQEKLMKKFYEFTAKNPTDWQTYEDMKSLAKLLFDIQIEDSMLPPEKREQGMDMIVILKKFPEFISTYHYSLHTQGFFESPGESIFLNLFGVAQAANSFHAHGLGILPTILSNILKIVSKKVNIVNRLLFDEGVVNVLQMEEHAWKENKEKYKKRFPLEHAEEIQKKISELGRLKDGSTMLDKLRQIITQIGNALAFIMVARAGYKRYCYELQQFVDAPGESCETVTKAAEQSAETCSAAVFVDVLLKQRPTGIGSDYYHIFLTMFDEATLLSEQCQHLQLFYLLLPSLSINFIESLMQAKTSLSGKIFQKSYFIDDGFAIGCAYFILLLRQKDQFSGLNWFESVCAKFENDKLIRSVSASAEAAMIVRKSETYIHEYEWLQFSFIAAQQVLKSDQVTFQQQYFL